MNQNKLETITKLFEGNEIRSVWNSEEEDYYFSVVDIIAALVKNKIPRNYWSDLKRKLIDEGSELHEKIVQLKLKSRKDGKRYLTDTLNTEGVFRLIESVPSSRAEPFKLWLAKLGREEIDNVFDPSKGITKMIDYYLAKGYTLEWIEVRVKAILDRKKLTNAWKDTGITDNVDYAILTNEIYKEWSGMTAQQYKFYKNIRKENLRDNMTDIEVALTDLSEIATRELVKKHKPMGLKANKEIAKMGGHASRVARDDIEKNLGRSVVSKDNALSYKYIEEDLMIENKE
ncbi:MAG: phage antirepressor protein [Bacilli bacterium]|nr:phage antirepressor protein [Bacilli bacterium]